MPTQILDQLSVLDLKSFRMETLVIESKALKANAFGDPSVRRNPVLIPKNAKAPMPVVLCLAGLTGNGADYFTTHYARKNTVEMLDEAVSMNKAPKALYVFVDALTSWGGSQFINSAQGQYEDYIVKELVPAIQENYDVRFPGKHWCVTGGSSGGYGALHLGSKFPELFGLVAAFAPDCFFEASLLPEIYKSLNDWVEFNGPPGLLKELKKGNLRKSKIFPSLVNAVGMSLCYANGELPIDPYTGQLKSSIWKKWKQNDPLVFLPKRIKNLRKLHGLLSDVGNRD